MRGVGQTSHMVDLLPDEDCIVIVPNSSTILYCKSLIESRRGLSFSKKVDVISVEKEEDLYRLYGITKKVFVDHSFFASKKNKDKILAEELLSLLAGIHAIKNIMNTRKENNG